VNTCATVPKESLLSSILVYNDMFKIVLIILALIAMVGTTTHYASANGPNIPSPSPSPSGAGAGPDTNNYTSTDNFVPGDYVINRWHRHLPMWTESDTLRVIRAHAGEHLARDAAAAVAGWKAEAEAAAAEAHSK
jgi:hypothetical protein